MLVQLVCRSDKEAVYKEISEEPMELGEALAIPRTTTLVILVPTLEHYHQVQGELFFTGYKAEVICLLPPSEYCPPMGKVPVALVTDSHKPVCDPTVADSSMGRLTYYFIKKDKIDE